MAAAPAGRSTVEREAGAAARRSSRGRRELRGMESEENLYAEMRAAIRADQERAARRRAEHGPAEPPPTPPAVEPPPEAEPRRGLRRWLGGRRDQP